MSSDEDPGESFAAFFQREMVDVRRREPRRTHRVGELVEGTVVKVGREAVFLELDGREQAYIEASELLLPDGSLDAKEGRRLSARVVSVEDSGTLRLGRSAGRPGSPDAIQAAKQSGIPVEGKVVGVNKGGIEIDLGGTRAFCPISQIEARSFVKDASVYVGQTLEVLVTEIRDAGRSVTVSRRALLERQAREEAEQTLTRVEPGAVLDGTVTAVREFGAFVDLGGVEGLIPASEIGYDRGASVADVLGVGDAVRVQVIDRKQLPGKRPDERTLKITLSLKALAQDPWETLTLSEGDVVAGTVVRVLDFGAFVRLSSGIEGLLHVSELGGQVQSATQTLAVGQPLCVVVQTIDRTQRRISLGAAPAGATAGSRLGKPTTTVGAVVQGTVDRVEPFGVFVQIDGTSGRSGRGLVPNAELGIPRSADTRRAFPAGTRVTAKVLEIAEGRIRLSLRAAKDDAERADFEGFRDRATAPRSLGTLGDLLKDRKC